MDYSKKTEIEKSVLKFSKENAKHHEYAYAFGIVWSFLNDKQLLELEKMVKE